MKQKVIAPVPKLTWSSSSVVRPNVPFSRRYSSLPTRMSVSSSSAMTSAITFRGGSPLRPRSSVTTARTRPRDAPNSASCSNFASSRTTRQRGW